MKIGLAVVAFALTMAGASAPAQAAIDKTLDVHVYQLCDNDGANCASLGPSGNSYFEEQTDAIWAQAGVNVNFIFKQQIKDSTYLNINDSGTNSFNALAADYGSHGASTSYVALYLVHTIAGAFGEGYVGAGGAVIGMDSVMGYNNGNGRLDTIAHELGHNLGLVVTGAPEENPSDPNHSQFSNQLMAGGGIRQSPTSIDNIAPSGTALDYIPNNEIATARSSSLLVAAAPVPEPGEWAMMGAGLVLTGGVVRRRKARVVA